MPKFYSYIIEPIQSREEICQSFIKKVMKKGAIYNNRRVTLNERFSLIERGFKLSPILSENDTNLSGALKVREVSVNEEFAAAFKQKLMMRENLENQK